MVTEVLAGIAVSLWFPVFRDVAQLILLDLAAACSDVYECWVDLDWNHEKCFR